MGPHLTFTIFCLETPLCFVPDEAYCPSVLPLQPENASSITIDFLVLLTEKENVTMHLQIVRSLWSPFVCKHTHTHTRFCAFVCMSLSVCMTTHGFMHICTVFAFALLGGKAISADARRFSDCLRGPNRLFLYLQPFH